MSRPSPELVSGEGVAFALNHASAGSRIVAAVIDLIVQLILLLVLILPTVFIGNGGDPAAIETLLLVEVLLAALGYPVLWEWLGHGRTLGKLWLGLRVVRDDGGPIGFRQAFVRGLSGVIIEKPGIFSPIGTGVGLFVMIANRRDKRIGDLMAGTFVLNERGGPRRSLAARDFVPPPHLIPWAQTLDLSRVDDQLGLALRQFLVRAPELTPSAQMEIGEDLRHRIAAVTAPPPPPGTPTPWFLVTVLAERRRRTAPAAFGAAAGPGWTPPTGPGSASPTGAGWTAPAGTGWAPPAGPAGLTWTGSGTGPGSAGSPGFVHPGSGPLAPASPGTAAPDVNPPGFAPPR